MVDRGPLDEQQLYQRLTNLSARLARDGALGTTILKDCPLLCVPVLEVVADALLDSGAVNTAGFSTVIDEEGAFSLSILAENPADTVIVMAACGWANRFCIRNTV